MSTTEGRSWTPPGNEGGLKLKQASKAEIEEKKSTEQTSEMTRVRQAPEGATQEEKSKGKSRAGYPAKLIFGTWPLKRPGRF